MISMKPKLSLLFHHHLAQQVQPLNLVLASMWFPANIDDTQYKLNWDAPCMLIESVLCAIKKSCKWLYTYIIIK
jgi:hypothetical protein